MDGRPPPLLLKYLTQIKEIEKRAAQCATEDLMNLSAGIRDIRSLAVAMFEVYWDCHSPMSSDEESLARGITQEIAACLAGVFRLACKEVVVTREVRDAIDQWVKIRCIAWGRSPAPTVKNTDDDGGMGASAIAHMVALASQLGIKKLCKDAGISPASYHLLRNGRGKEKVQTKMSLFLANHPISK